MLLMFHVSLGGPTTDTCCQNFGSLNLLAVSICHLFKIGSFVPWVLSEVMLMMPPCLVQLVRFKGWVLHATLETAGTLQRYGLEI